MNSQVLTYWIFSEISTMGKRKMVIDSDSHESGRDVISERKKRLKMFEKRKTFKCPVCQKWVSS